MKTAILLGATGLIGTELLNQLLLDDNYEQIKTFARRTSGISHPKLTELIIDFDKPEAWIGRVTGDVLFSMLGTTIKKAGNNKTYYKTDYTYQYQMAEAAVRNKVENYVLISAAGANANSRMFYNKMKGELDRDVQDLAFKHISIIRPSFLDGDRKESRLGEKIGIIVTRLITLIIPFTRKYRPIHASVVARAMRNAVQRNNGKVNVYELEAVFNLANSNA